MLFNRKKHHHEHNNDHMNVRIKKNSGQGGIVELRITGSADAGDIPELKQAIHRFEKESHMKCYINLGDAKHLCPAAIEELLELTVRIEERGDMLDIVDISVEAELEIRELGLQNVIRPLYPWPYPAIGA